jgi:hypothetical protein
MPGNRNRSQVVHFTSARRFDEGHGLAFTRASRITFVYRDNRKDSIDSRARDIYKRPTAVESCSSLPYLRVAILAAVSNFDADRMCETFRFARFFRIANVCRCGMILVHVPDR